MKRIVITKDVPIRIRETIRLMGYEILDDNTMDGYVDTILYSSDNNTLGYLNVFDNVIDMNSGAFVIDVKNKSVDEIVNMIENRTYTSLF